MINDSITSIPALLITGIKTTTQTKMCKFQDDQNTSNNHFRNEIQWSRLKLYETVKNRKITLYKKSEKIGNMSNSKIYEKIT